MWFRWLPWKFIIRKIARAQGFLDPVNLISQLQNFSKPSEVVVPAELMRLSSVLHARGLINSQAIQHNLDWVWPYWVEKQFNPKSSSFIPRAFSLTHINLTHRNWTAIGLPDMESLPIVDPRGLVTPFYDGWSIDFWIVSEGGDKLFPSKLQNIEQKLVQDKLVSVITESKEKGLLLKAKAQVKRNRDNIVCEISAKGFLAKKGWLIVAIRPYNPEGVSFIKNIEINKDKTQIVVNQKKVIFLNSAFDKYKLSNYDQGDVSCDPLSFSDQTKISCSVEMATGAFFYKIGPNKEREVKLKIPLEKVKKTKNKQGNILNYSWQNLEKNSTEVKIANKKYQYLYDSSKIALMLHSGDSCFAGPFTYKRFWIRDTVYALQALLYLGLEKRAKKLIKLLLSTQKMNGYFSSQYGEWDSNGQVLWALKKFAQLTNKKDYSHWQKSIKNAVFWIEKKRMPKKENYPYSGLLPAGFSAEHFGPNDFYYWDDFWAEAGIRAALFLSDSKKNQKQNRLFKRYLKDLEESIGKSLQLIKDKTGKDMIPASYSRRMDSSAIGSLVAGYPLMLWQAKDVRLLATTEYLIKNCFYQGAFFHNMSHSGLNPYLTLSIAQVLLRAGDGRFRDVIDSVAKIASPTGGWPEAVHPKTKGGCMGDGQHVWAAAEWISIIRNCFVREEAKKNKLILCSGIYPNWYKTGESIYIKNALTVFGEISLTIIPKDTVEINWQANWYKKSPLVEICLPGYKTVMNQGETSKKIILEKEQSL
ncbi:MAG: hypothetical protein K9L69_02685 [Candidatus Omnitrophica bacterium]|nr:hypothetical protein [Candidatus Omnitrophota bacterium]MCF7895025.1 hypothetical protein [Candidatus Omnitrophota bacterium]